LQCRTLTLSISESVDEAAADAPKSPMPEPHTVFVSSAQLDAYHPMEDKVYVNEKEKLYGVFDGHGGDICSRYMVDRVPKLILDKLARKTATSDYSCMLKSSFIEADTAFLNEHRFALKNAATGSCGVCVLERDGFLYVCNLGDSRVQVARKDESGELSTITLTHDHNTKNEDEVRRVCERTSDPVPIRANVNTNTEGKRVGGVLLLTRAFGNGVFKRKDMSMQPFLNYLPYITSEPEINVHKILPSDKFIVIASDGLYERCTPEQITSFIGELMRECKCRTDMTKMASRVITKLLEKLASLMGGGKTADDVAKMPNRKTFMDDTTLIILFLDEPPQSP